MIKEKLVSLPSDIRVPKNESSTDRNIRKQKLKEYKRECKMIKKEFKEKFGDAQRTRVKQISSIKSEIGGIYGANVKPIK